MAWEAAIVTGGVAVFGMLLFKKPICGHLDRVQSGKIGGQEFSTTASQSVVQKANEPEKLQAVLDADRSPVLTSLEAQLKSNMETRGITDDKDKVKILTRLAAQSLLDLQFERTSHIIYGSQLGLLVLANTRPISRVEIESVFNEAKSKFPTMYHGRTVDQYLNYLVQSRLLEAKGEVFQITGFAKDFMHYLVNNGGTQQRAG